MIDLNSVSHDSILKLEICMISDYFRLRQEKLQRELNDAANESVGFIKRSFCVYFSRLIFSNTLLLLFSILF